MSSRFSTAMVCAMAVLFVMASLAIAQTSGTGTSGQSGTGIPGAGIGTETLGPGMELGTPGQPSDQLGRGITGDTTRGPTEVEMGTPESPINRPGIGVDRPGTRITEQPGAVSPGLVTERPGNMTGQSEPGMGSQPNMPGGAPMPRPSGTGSPGAGGVAGMGR